MMIFKNKILKNSFSKIISEVLLKTSVINLPLIGLVFVFVSLGCGGAPYTLPNAEYFGVWSANGTTFTIRPDNSAEYSAPDIYLQNAEARIYQENGQKQFSFWDSNYGIKFKIDSEPSGNKMTLNGISYQRTENGAPLAPANALKIPTDAEIEKIIKATISDYIKAVEAGNPEQFLANRAKDRERYSDDDFKEEFAKTLADKDKSLASLRDAQNRPIQFNKKADMMITPQEGLFSIDKVSFPSQPSQTIVNCTFNYKNGKWRFEFFSVSFN